MATKDSWKVELNTGDPSLNHKCLEGKYDLEALLHYLVLYCLMPFMEALFAFNWCFLLLPSPTVLMRSLEDKGDIEMK